jgi:uncharacterized protein
MEQLEMLWAYQQEDMKADRIALDIRRSPTRQKLEKSRDFIADRKEQFTKIEEQVAAMADRMDIIRDALPRCEEQLASLSKEMEENAPSDLEGVQALIAKVSRCRETINSYETEMSRIAKDSAEFVKRQQRLQVEAAKEKQNFMVLRESYDKELNEQKAKLEAQRAVADKAAEGVDPKMMEEYRIIKKHITPPMARLLNDQCGGCNTALPSAVLRKIKSGTEIIECETCGRMIIPEAEK